MRTKSKDKIKLSTGEVMTLGEALLGGRLEAFAIDDRGARTENVKEATHYIARELGGELFWEIGKVLFFGGFPADLSQRTKRGNP